MTFVQLEIAADLSTLGLLIEAVWPASKMCKIRSLSWMKML